MERLKTTCCVVGGGPAGMMLGLLLARTGVEVMVLEKHKDFFRDFRGDTVHPSTLELMKELGYLKELLSLPHQEVTAIRGVYGDYPFQPADLTGLKITCPFIALMPQWDFLDFLSGKAKAYSGFHLLMEHEATDLIKAGGRVTGVRAKTPRGEVEIEAKLVVACDGRHSVLRDESRLPVREVGVPMDVLWFRISRHENDSVHMVMGKVNFGKMLILLERGDYFQAGLIVKKGSFEEIKSAGLEQFHQTIEKLVPEFGDRANEIEDWDQVKLLSVQINRLEKWFEPGLLLIGDAAHAMSPVFGVGINLAVQDAVATANILAEPLKRGDDPDPLLVRVQERREKPTQQTQRMQRLAHKGLGHVFKEHGFMKPPLLLKVIFHIPGIQHFIAKKAGIGFQPEHIATPDIGPR